VSFPPPTIADCAGFQKPILRPRKARCAPRLLYRHHKKKSRISPKIFPNMLSSSFPSIPFVPNPFAGGSVARRPLSCRASARGLCGQIPGPPICRKKHQVRGMFVRGMEEGVVRRIPLTTIPLTSLRPYPCPSPDSIGMVQFFLAAALPRCRTRALQAMFASTITQSGFIPPLW